MYKLDLIGIGYSISTYEEAVQFTQKAKNIISSGGWLKQLSLEKENIEFNKNRAKLEFDKLKLDYDKQKIDFETSKRIYKDYQSTKWISRIGFLLAFFSLLWQIIRELILKN